MINGMEILAQNPIMEFGPGSATSLGIGFVVAIILAIIVGFQESSLCDAILCFLLVIAGTLLISCIVGSITEVPSGEYTYDVIFHENVDMNEIYDNYIIKSQNGKIFTIQKK